MIRIFVAIVLMSFAVPARAQVLPQDSARGLDPRIKVGAFVRVTTSAAREGRILEVNDSSIRLVGAAPVRISDVRQIELRRRSGRRGGTIGGIIGGVIGGWTALIASGLDSTNPRPSDVRRGAFVFVSTAVVGGLGALIGTAIHHSDSWETVFSGT
jgi:hypothetical protein